MKTNWDKRFLELAEFIGSWSKDRSRGVGAVITKGKHIISIGYNGFPAGCDDELDERHERPAKYHFTVHAEENAIATAAKYGIATDGGVMFTNLFPCERCAGNIINAGIKKIVCNKQPNYNDPTYGEMFKISRTKFIEADVEIVIIEEK